MPKLVLVFAIVAGLLVQAAPGVGQGRGLGLKAGWVSGENDLRIPLAAMTLDGTPAPSLGMLPGLPASWARHPAVSAQPGVDVLSSSLLQTHLTGNTDITIMPYVGGWAVPLDRSFECSGLAPGDQPGARFAWNFGGGVIWFFRDVLGVDFGVRWTEKEVSVSRKGLRVGDINTSGKLDLLEQSFHVNVSMPLR